MPEHPIDQLTSRELAQYRRDLTNSLKGLPEGAPVRATLDKRLAAVDAEQEERRRIAQRGGAL